MQKSMFLLLKADGTTSVEQHPRNDTNGIITYSEDNGGSPNTSVTSTIQMRPGTDDYPRKVTLSHTRPYEVVTDDGNTVVKFARANIVCTVPIDMDVSAAIDFCHTASGTLLEPQLQDAVTKGFFPY